DQVFLEGTARDKNNGGLHTQRHADMPQHLVPSNIGDLPVEQNKVKGFATQGGQQIPAGLMAVARISGGNKDLLNMPGLVQVFFQRGNLHSEFEVESALGVYRSAIWPTIHQV